MDKFTPRISVHTFNGEKYSILATCPDCGKTLIAYSNVSIEALRERQETIKTNCWGCLHCNLKSENMCRGVPRTISKNTAIMNLSLR